MPKITDFQPDPANANVGTEVGLRALDDSLREVGLGRSIVVDKNGIVLAGNKTQERAVDQGFQDAIVVETNGRQLVVVKRTDLDLNDPNDTRARKYAYYDNRVGQLDLAWDVDQILRDVDAGIDLGNLFVFSLPEINSVAAVDDVIQQTPPIVAADTLFPSDNDFEIPTLRMDMQAQRLDLPFNLYGAQGRSKIRPGGTLAFYVDDFLFEAVWNNPTRIVELQPTAIVEPNFSVFRSMPVAIGAYHIYRKRWIARWAQDYGVRVFVDLNVATKWNDINMLGVPSGWTAYCTRAYLDEYSLVDEQHDIACTRAGTKDILFVVYGGGKHMKQVCKQRGWIWLEDQRTRVRAMHEVAKHG